jgi:YHS domain-containing protein
MNSRTKTSAKALVVSGALLAGLLLTQGCKDEPASQQSSASSLSHDHPACHEHPTAADTAVAAEETAENATAAAAAAVEQTTCPVMAGNPINKDLFVEYEGKKVYFCCKGCEDVFLADPAKYIAKLPQFKK